MSTSTILGFAGAAVGSFVGMPQLGFLIGSSLGGYIDYSNQRSYGPKPEDLKAISSSYGTPIPYVIGSPRIAGQVWWSSEKRVIETETEVGKGGGPTVTTYSTEVDLLIGLAEQQIAGVTRGWSNGKLVWTDLSSADDASRIASEDQNLWRRLTVYTGTYTQLPDPTYEAAVGTDLAPAYRGRAYIVLEGLQLGNSGQLPNLTWEVCSHVDASTDIVRRWAVQPSGQTFARGNSHNDGFPAIVAMQPEIRVATLLGATVYRWDMDGNHLGTSGRTEASDAYPPLNTAGYSGNFVPYWTTNPYPVGVLSGLGVTVDLSAAATATGAGTPCLRVGLMLDLMGPIPSGRYFGGVALCSDGVHAIIYTAPSNATAPGAVVEQWHIVRFDVLAMSVDLVRSGTLAVTSNMSSLGVGNNQVLMYRATMLEDDLEHVWITGYGGYGETAMYAINALGVLALADSLRAFDGDDAVLDWSWTLQSIWAESGICIVVAGDSLQAFRRRGSSVQAVPLDEAVTMLCTRAGMSADQFDVTDLASVTKPVRSLAIAQVGDTRAVLDQLRTSHHFEASLSDMIYFRRRASDPVVTIPWADLGAAPNQADPQPLAITRASDLELPAQWALQYINVSDDYQSGTEYADRIISGQASATMLQLGIGMTPGEAKGVVDAIALDALAGLTTTNISLSMSYAEVEPADVVQVIDAAAATYRFRVGRRQDSAGVLKLDLVADDAAAVVSAGVTDTTYEPQGTVLAVSQTLLYLLDIPLLRDQDDGPGYYLAARGNTATWSGATVYSSTNGTDYATAATVAESAVMGVATTTLGNWTGGPVMDEVNTLTVNVAHGQLASTTRAALLADPTVNALLVGDEIIQFVTASLVSTAPNIYTVSRLLRGQRGTEWACTGHAAAERVVLLRTRGLRRVSQQASDLGRTLYIKGVTNGRSAAEVDAETFANTGACLKPWAPVNLRAAPGDGGTYTLTWDRRSRLNVIRDSRGTTIPLGEAAEAYEIDVYDSGASLVASYSATGPTVEIGGPTKVLQYGDGMVWPGEHGGYVYGMQYSYAGAPGRALQRFDGTTGAVLATSTAIAGRVQKMVYTGAGIAYALTIETDASDSYITACKLYRIDLATLAIGSPYDLFASLSRYTYDMAWDGTSVWTATGVGGTVELRSHDATTLAVTATHTLGATSNASLTIAADGAGAIFIGRIDYAKIKAYQPGSSTTLWTVDYGQVGALICTPSLLFADVVGVTSIDPATGAVIVAATEEAFGDFVAYGSDVAYWRLKVTISPAGSNFSGDIVRVLDGTTGAVSRSFPLAFDALAVIGAAAGNLLVRSRSTTSSSATLSHQYGPAAVLAGGSAKVYQISATVGRGYPATVSLP